MLETPPPPGRSAGVCFAVDGSRVGKRDVRFPRGRFNRDEIDLSREKTTHRAVLCSLLIRVAREDHAIIHSHTPANPSHAGVDLTGFLLPNPRPARLQLLCRHKIPSRAFLHRVCASCEKETIQTPGDGMEQPRNVTRTCRRAPFKIKARADSDRGSERNNARVLSVKPKLALKETPVQ